MIIKGTVQDGQIHIDVSGVLSEGTSVLVTPLSSSNIDIEKNYNIELAKSLLREIIELPSLGPNDGFSGASHDSVLYGVDE